MPVAWRTPDSSSLGGSSGPASRPSGQGFVDERLLCLTSKGFAWRARSVDMPAQASIAANGKRNHAPTVSSMTTLRATNGMPITTQSNASPMSPRP